MPGAKEKEKKTKEPIEKDGKGFFQKLKEILKKGLNLAKNAVIGGAGFAVDTATAVGVRVLAGQKGYNNWIENKSTEADVAEIKAANEKMIGSKVVCRKGDFHLEGEIEKFTKTKDGDLYTVKLCDGTTVDLSSNQFVSRETFDRQNKSRHEEYKVKFFDKESWDRYQAAAQHSKEENAKNEQEKELKEDDISKNSKTDDKFEPAQPENHNSDEKSAEKPEKNIDNEKVPDNSDRDMSWFDELFGQQEKTTSEQADLKQEQETSEYFYFDDPNTVTLSKEEEEEIKAKENNEQEQDMIPKEKDTVRIPNNKDDIGIGDHVLYSYKGKNQEATITAINKKSIEVETNDGRKCKIKNADINKSIFGLEDIKNDKVMSQCVLDDKNTKFSPEFRDAYNAPEKEELAFNSDNRDELDLDLDFSNYEENSETEIADKPSLEEQMEDARNETGTNELENDIDEHKQDEMSMEM